MKKHHIFFLWILFVVGIYALPAPANAQPLPDLVTWSDRRPIARWFISEGTQSSAINPRGYLWDSTLDVSNQSQFNARMLSWADDVITRMNSMNPKPQGLLIWDLEGQEFYQAFTYVGNPPKMHDIAPEMDAVADQMFAKFINAGYKVGMTLRASTFLTGTTLPATCTSSSQPHPYTGVFVQDVFIKTNAQYPYRAYVCSAPNTWTQVVARGPYFQTTSNDDTMIYNDLKNKIAYAKNRWSARIFYVDSTVYSNGTPLKFSIFRQLQTDFPDVVLFPENATQYTPEYWGASVPYKEAAQGYLNTPQAAKDMYPQAFSLLQTLSVDMTAPTTRTALITSVRNGNILFVDGWWDNPKNADVLTIYQAAQACPVAPTNLRRVVIGQ